MTGRGWKCLPIMSINRTEVTVSERELRHLHGLRVLRPLTTLSKITGYKPTVRDQIRYVVTAPRNLHK